ncbi:MAG TPA: FAD-binding oxidoreductase [Nocardioidaceae bacterium]
MFWTTADSPDYDERRALFNAMIDRRPRLIAGCETPADVAEALDRARRDGLAVAVRAGGHSVAGMSTNDDGLVVDVRPMKRIEIDPAQRRARVGAGVTWGELDAAAQQHGLATTGGRVSTTGVAGFTLGGGSGWLERAHGLACDNLVAVDLVTADGREVRADADHAPELFWALHGGGGNFGVATALEFRLHPVGPEVMAGLMAWPFEAGPAVARAFRDWAEAAPDELGSGLLAITAPPEEFVPEHLQGAKIVGVAGMWCGSLDDGADYFAGLRHLEPEIDLVAARPYTEFQSMIDDPPGNRHYWSADYHSALPDEALDVFLDGAAAAPSPLTQQLALPWGGALARIPEDSTPLSRRDTAWLTHPFAVWEDAADDTANIEWVRQFRRDIAPYTNGGVYLNFIGAEGEDRIRQAFGAEKYHRLVQVKTEYDPRNVFRGNQNIAPSVPVG